MRRPIIAGNWKMHKTIPEALELAAGLRRELIDLDDVEIVVCPPFTALVEVADGLLDSNIKVGAQNVSWEKSGAFTGEVSAAMLKDCGCSYVIVGHSERRFIFGESDEDVNRKIKAVVLAGMTPIVCVGEKLTEREEGKTFEVIKRQLRQGLANLTPAEVKKLVIAYEPVWAIGTGKTATPGIAQEVHTFVRREVASLAGEEAAGEIRIQYGGSVKPENISELMAEKDVDGALVGGASLEVDSFAQIVKKAKKGDGSIY